jgi:NAD-dependent SIR2 family protein deacetylase
MTESKFKVGDVVILQNLKIHPEFNGLETTVIGPNELRQPLRGSEPMPIAYLYAVDINLAGFEPGLLVAEYQMQHKQPPVELGNWSMIETVTDEHTLLAVRRAADLIGNAEALLIMAGAGMGVDSGLPDFRSAQGFWRAYPPLEKLGLSFEEMAQPHWFAENPKMAWAWYGHRQQLYRETRPHAGYQLLREWGQAMSAGSFVLTSNVDGHFFFADFLADRIVEKHGDIHRYQCTIPCTAAIWLDDPPDLKVDLTTLQALGKLPHCPECGALARPNVLMFNDDAWIPNVTREQNERYTDWLAGLSGNRLVIIECGAGTAIPTIRLAAERIAERSFTTLIRINPAATEGDESAISVHLPALQALSMIQQALPESFRRRCAASAPKELSQEELWRLSNEALKTNPGGVISTVPMSHLKNIKFSKIYSKAWHITLPSGWTAWVDHLDVCRTYLKMGTGLTDRADADEEIESARVFVRKNFHGPEPVVIPPKLYDATSDSPILPPLRFAAQIRTFEPLTEEYDGSWMNLIWFAEIDDDKTTKAFIEEALKQIDWKASASGYLE